ERALQKIGLTLTDAAGEKFYAPRHDILAMADTYFDDFAAVEGPEEFIQTRDALAEVLRANMDALSNSEDDPGLRASLNGPLVDLIAYCAWDKEQTLQGFLGF